MQIRVESDGPWHRPEEIDGGHKTACGKVIFAYMSRSDGSDNLCLKCFTTGEHATAELALLEKEAKAYDRDLFYHEDDEPTDPDGKETLDKEQK
jgi:hypothetical protein